ncbi:MAG: hypothetical protein KA143_10640 [Saprospiraceae bacterium]|nr:hypothetical protein [Saprospiraceae bacterium]
MIHTMINQSEIEPVILIKKIKQKEVRWGGNRRLKIYGTLNCNSGKRMNRENRVFFSSEKEAITSGYRPCGHCLKSKYNEWKQI